MNPDKIISLLEEANQLNREREKSYSFSAKIYDVTDKMDKTYRNALRTCFGSADELSRKVFNLFNLEDSQKNILGEVYSGLLFICEEFLVGEKDANVAFREAEFFINWGYTNWILDKESLNILSLPEFMSASL